ncbi:MAG: hypothetical protein MJZ49_01530 [Bacteroidales bacterium]|nr:hypothetical protein [Bacteroidales bacterium]
MKKTLAFFTLLLGLMAMFAQSGPTFPYQAVVRNSQNQLIKDSTFAIGVEVYQGADLKYSETQSVTTNANGQFTMNIGGGAVVSGAMNNIADWSVAKFRITYHLSEGDIVSENAVSPVPYALQAANVAESAGLDCADVKTCIADTLNHYTTTTALEQMLQQISVRMDAQEATIDSLRHLVDSLSDLSHGGGSTPSAIFFCDSSTVKDVDQNEYHTVAIGNQCWMKENLRTKTHTYGSVYTNPNIDSVIYGRYYDWEAIMQVDDANSSDYTPTGIHQGICPTGWHVPSQAEWNTLISYVNSETGYKCDGNNDYIANALSSTTGWVEPESCCAGDGNSATINKTGFSAVPSGYKLSQTDSYNGNGWVTFIGSSTQSNSQKVRILYLRNDDPNTSTVNSSYKMDGISVRCLRDAGIVGNAGSNESGIGSGNTPSTPATMSCEDVMNCLGDTLGNLNAQIESQGTEIQTLNATVASQGETIAAQGETITAQGNTIDSLNHVVDSLSNLNHGGGTAAFTCGTSKVKDVENNEYNTVQIGNQCWMAKSLRTSNVNDKGIVYTPDYDVATYGLLYDWQAAMQIEQGDTTSYTGSDVNHKGICPKGWHVPSKADWDTLTTYVSSVEAYKCNSSIASALSDSTGWKSSSICCAGDNSSATINITGFAAVPAGSFTDGFGGFGSDAYFWSATEYNNQMALCQSLHSLATGVSSYEDYKSHCYSVRCVRNADAGGDTPATPPTMSCEDVMNCLGDTLGHLNARITSQGAEIETLNGTVTAQANTIDSLNHIVDSLSNFTPDTPDTPASDTTAVPFNCGTDKLKDVDSNEYSTIKIGNQCWMKENLRTVTSHCGRVMNANDICLYDWAAAMQVSEANATTITVGVKHQGICPSGWHVPSDADWDALTSYVYNSTNPDYKCSGCDQRVWEQDTRCIAKALSSTTGWNTSSNSCAVGNSPEDNDATGFSAVPAGAYYGESFGVTNVGTGAYMWSSTQKGDGSAWYRLLGCGNSRVVRSSSNKGICYSVRCLKNN